MDDLTQQTLIKSMIQDSISSKKALLENDLLLKKIQSSANLCINSLKQGGRIILAGNGGSAADAQHIAAEFVSRFAFDRPGLPALSLATDTSMLTAISNDYGYENVFKRQVEANGTKGDVFIGISTSGTSENIIQAFVAAQKKGLHTIGLTGNLKNNMNDYCDITINTPSGYTARIQEMHILIGHCICAIVEQELFGRST